MASSLVLIFIFILQFMKTPLINPPHRQNLLQYGQWLHNFSSEAKYWQPKDCNYKEFTKYDIHNCIGQGQRVMFWGDRTTRAMFWHFVRKINSKVVENSSLQENIHMSVDGINVHFLFDPFLNDKDGGLDVIKKISQGPEEAGQVEFLYITSGIDHLWTIPDKEAVLNYKHLLRQLMEILKTRTKESFGNVYFNPVQSSVFQLFQNKDFYPTLVKSARNLRALSDKVFNFKIGSNAANNGVFLRTDGSISAYYTPVFNHIGVGHPEMYKARDYSYTDQGLEIEIQMMLNHHCNLKLGVSQTCSSKPYPRPNELVICGLILLAIPAFIIFFFQADIAFSIASIGLGTVVSVMYAYLCDRTYQFNKQQLQFSTPILVILLQLWAVLTAVTTRNISTVAESVIDLFFNEFKGILISFNLILMVSGVTKMNILTEITINCLLLVQVFIFALKPITKTKLIAELVRFNLTATLLSLTLRTSYDLYVLPIHLSFWIFHIYLTHAFYNFLLAYFPATIDTHFKGSIFKSIFLILITMLARATVIEFGFSFKAYFICLFSAIAAIIYPVPIDLTISLPIKIVIVLVSLLSFFGLTAISFLYDISVFNSQLAAIATISFMTVYVLIRTKYQTYISFAMTWAGHGLIELYLLSFHTLLANDGTSYLFWLTTGDNVRNTYYDNIIRHIENFVIVALTFALCVFQLSKKWSNLNSIILPSTKLLIIQNEEISLQDVSENETFQIHSDEEFK